ncbi:MAG TPA: ATP-binding protein, partial [Nitrospiraceae bacterium]|nr:ATP-binding protein [Nitrospiraceae bacterium]
MYTSISIENLRGFETISTSDFRHFNLIGGKNNSGKTTLLEGLFLLTGAVRPNLAININAFRGLATFRFDQSPQGERPWDAAFRDYRTELTIRLTAWDRAKKKRTVTIQQESLKTVPVVPSSTESKDTRGVTGFPYALRLLHTYDRKKSSVLLRLSAESPIIEPNLPIPMPCIFVMPRQLGPSKEEAERLGKLQVIKGEEVLINALRTIEPRLKSITVVQKGNEPILHADIGKPRLMPLNLMGGGITRLTTILLSIADAPDGLVLIDEIENGFHYSSLTGVWRAIRELAIMTRTQIFAATHSMECIMAAHKVFSSVKNYDLSYHRIDRKDGTATVKHYDKHT